MSHRIYVASSWRNEYFPVVVRTLRQAGHQVYYFRNPPTGDPGFKWSNIDRDYMQWSPQHYRAQLSHPMAVKQLANDLDALRWCDTCVLVLPCGRSAHTEAGWLAGQGKRVVVYIPEAQEPELMYGLFDAIACDMTELLAALAGEDAETNR